MSAAASGTTTWVEFTRDLCEQLNCHKCVVLVGDAAIIQPITTLVDEACRHSAVTMAFAKSTSDEIVVAPSAMPHVTFTTAENQQMAQKCMAVFGRVPFLAVLDMRDDDDEHSFVLDLKAVEDSPMRDAQLSKAIVDFLVRVGRGTEPRCRQGAAPPLKDVFAPTHGAVLSEAKAAVTSTFHRLIRPASAGTQSSSSCISSGGGTSGSASCSAPCGALCVFWSDRCPCCPGVLMLVEAMVQLIRLVAQRHAGHPSCDVSFHFPFVVANIDDNDFTQAEWPVAQREQVVPSLVAYPAPSYAPVLFTGERLPVRLAEFICGHCLPSAELVACTPHITEEVAKVAAQLSIDALMTVMEEEGEGYGSAVRAYEDFEAHYGETARVEQEEEEKRTAQLYATFASVRTTALPFSLETEVRRMSAEGGAAAAGSQAESTVGAEEEEEEGDNVAETKGAGAASAAAAAAAVVSIASTATAAVVPPLMTGTASAVNAYKRPRE